VIIITIVKSTDTTTTNNNNGNNNNNKHGRFNDLGPTGHVHSISFDVCKTYTCLPPFIAEALEEQGN
jgi:hypothetical protein